MKVRGQNYVAAMVPASFVVVGGAFLAVFVVAGSVGFWMRRSRVSVRAAIERGDISTRAPSSVPLSRLTGGMQLGGMAVSAPMCSIEFHSDWVVLNAPLPAYNVIAIRREALSRLAVRPRPLNSALVLFDGHDERLDLSFLASGQQLRATISSGGWSGLVDHS